MRIKMSKPILKQLKGINMLDFIKKFQTPETIEIFTKGMCFWFAFILENRFKHEAYIMYAPIDNHFMVRYKGRLYDITGDVTDKYKKVIPWNSDQVDFLERERIIKYCIYKED